MTKIYEYLAEHGSTEDIKQAFEELLAEINRLKDINEQDVQDTHNRCNACAGNGQVCKSIDDDQYITVSCTHCNGKGFK